MSAPDLNAAIILASDVVRSDESLNRADAPAYCEQLATAVLAMAEMLGPGERRERNVEACCWTCPYALYEFYERDEESPAILLSRLVCARHAPGVGFGDLPDADPVRVCGEHPDFWKRPGVGAAEREEYPGQNREPETVELLWKLYRAANTLSEKRGDSSGSNEELRVVIAADAITAYLSGTPSEIPDGGDGTRGGY